MILLIDRFSNDVTPRFTLAVVPVVWTTNQLILPLKKNTQGAKVIIVRIFKRHSIFQVHLTVPESPKKHTQVTSGGYLRVFLSELDVLSGGV